MKLHHHPLSGHSHRAVLIASLLNIPHELVEVDLEARIATTRITVCRTTSWLETASAHGRSRGNWTAVAW
jgi:hypothetical protein